MNVLIKIYSRPKQHGFYVLYSPNIICINVNLISSMTLADSGFAAQSTIWVMKRFIVRHKPQSVPMEGHEHDESLHARPVKFSELIWSIYSGRFNLTSILVNVKTESKNGYVVKYFSSVNLAKFARQN